MLRLALLAPDIVQAILCGRQAFGLTLKRTNETPISCNCGSQREALGFSAW